MPLKGLRGRLREQTVSSFAFFLLFIVRLPFLLCLDFLSYAFEPD